MARRATSLGPKPSLFVFFALLGVTSAPLAALAQGHKGAACSLHRQSLAW